MWDERYGWPEAGSEWSDHWGGDPAAQWHGTIYPRLQPFLPASSILEIAPGMGRWTTFLLGHCEKLTGVDLTPRCVATCKERFAHEPKASFFLNDGRNLPMVEDGSVDLAFSFDSLVHVELDELAGYLNELAKKLAPDGIAFIHHSNFGHYERSVRVTAKVQPTMRLLPQSVKSRLIRIGVSHAPQWRAPSVTAENFAVTAEQAGLHCFGQELITWWSGMRLLDCISLVTRPGSKWDRPLVVRKNRALMAEAYSIRRYSLVYRNKGAVPAR